MLTTACSNDVVQADSTAARDALVANRAPAGVGLAGDAGGGVPVGQEVGEAVGAPAVYWGDSAA